MSALSQQLLLQPKKLDWRGIPVQISLRKASLFNQFQTVCTAYYNKNVFDLVIQQKLPKNKFFHEKIILFLDNLIFLLDHNLMNTQPFSHLLHDIEANLIVFNLCVRNLKQKNVFGFFVQPKLPKNTIFSENFF